MTHRYDAVQLYDMGFGPRIMPVTPPDGGIAQGTDLREKDMGKAPGYLTDHGWMAANVNDERHRCPDYQTAKLWRDDWRSNVGLVAGDGFVIIDNDQGREFSVVIAHLLKNPLRRYVLDPKHERDAFVVRVLDFVGDGAPVANREFKFRKGVQIGKLSILARGKQAVISGTHPERRAPYVWSRELTSIADIPTMSEGAFEEFIRNLIIELDVLGWTLPVSAPVSARPPGMGHNNPPSDLLEEARSLLDEIPNRDSSSDITRTSVDEWLDDYPNWVKVAYALIAHLGAHAGSPEARDLWLTWSYGRAQTPDRPEKVWNSALTQPLLYGSLSLIKLVRSLVKPDAANAFPDVEPEMVKRDPTPVWDSLRDRWAYCAMHGFIDTLTGRPIGKEAFSDSHAYLAPALRAELHISKRLRPSVADMFLRQKGRVEVFDMTYAPGDPVFVPSSDPALPSFNKWKPTTVPAVAVPEAQIQKWLDHLTFVLGTSQERDLFLRWCAFVAQNPRLKPNWCFLIISDAGLGKDTMASPLKCAVGVNNHIDILSYALSDSFNPWNEKKLIIVGEVSQSKTGLNSPTEVNNRLKPLLASPPLTSTINRKNRPQYEIPNRCAVILFSNSQNPIHLEQAQRRVHVVNRAGETKRSLDYYEDMINWLNDGGAELCASYLLAYPLTDVQKREFSGPAPESEDKAELEDQNMHPQQSVLHGLIYDAREGSKEGTPWTLVATAEELSRLIKGKNGVQPSVPAVSGWLRDMERRKTGVRRCRIDPKHPAQCGMFGIDPHKGRLWLLADADPDGRQWSALTVQEIVALWKQLPPPKNATITPIRENFPAGTGEEPV